MWAARSPKRRASVVDADPQGGAPRLMVQNGPRADIHVSARALFEGHSPKPVVRHVVRAVPVIFCLLSTGSHAVTNRMTGGEAQDAMVQGNWLVQALNERRYAVELEPIAPRVDSEWGLLVFLKQTVWEMVDSVEGKSGFVDPTFSVGGRYTQWFSTPQVSGGLQTYHPTNFPYLTATQLISIVGAPPNYFFYTPWRPFNRDGVGYTNAMTCPGYDTLDYGWDYLRDMVAQLKWITLPCGVYGQGEIVETLQAGYWEAGDSRFWGRDSQCDTVDVPSTWSSYTPMVLRTSSFDIVDGSCVVAEWTTYKQEAQKIANGYWRDTGTPCGGCLPYQYWTYDGGTTNEQYGFAKASGSALLHRDFPTAWLSGKADWYLLNDLETNENGASVSVSVSCCNQEAGDSSSWWIPPWSSGAGRPRCEFVRTTYMGAGQTESLCPILCVPSEPVVHVVEVIAETNLVTTCGCGCSGCIRECSSYEKQRRKNTYGRYKVTSSPRVLIKYDFKYQN